MNAPALLLVLTLAAGGSPLPVTAQTEPTHPAGTPRPTRSTAVVSLTFLDVGQGDAVLIRSAEGRTALVDAGPSAPVAALRALGVDTLDLVVATHPHQDHIGGMVDVLDAFPVRFYMDNGEPHTTATYLALLERLERSPDLVYLAATPRHIRLGEVDLEILPLPPGPGEANDRSVGIVLRYGAFEAFLSGDSEVTELEWWTARGSVPDVEVLKAPHHGSDNGVTASLLHQARPEVVVISVGANGYGHPGTTALDLYASAGARVVRTDREGSVTVRGRRDGSWSIGPAIPLAETPVVAPTPRIELDVVADAPGNDHHNLNGEYVVIHNPDTFDADLSGWTLCDAARHCFHFPAGSVVAAGGRTRVHTGSGRNGEGSFYMGSRQAVWNNDGDTAVLTDTQGRVRARRVY